MRLHSAFTAVLFSSSLVPFAGCMVERQYDARHLDADLRDEGLDDAPPLADDVAYKPFTQARAGLIDGSIGPVTVSLAGADHQSLYDDGQYANIETVAQIEGHAVMTMLWITDSAHVLKPGFSASYSWSTDRSDAITVDMVGCVGQEMGVYDEYDMPADQIDVAVEENEEDPSAIDVSIIGRWQRFDDEGVPTGELATAKTRFTLAR